MSGFERILVKELMCSCSLASQPYLHACTDSFALIDPVMIDSVSWTDDTLLVPIAMSSAFCVCQKFVYIYMLFSCSPFLLK